MISTDKEEYKDVDNELELGKINKNLDLDKKKQRKYSYLTLNVNDITDEITGINRFKKPNFFQTELKHGTKKCIKFPNIMIILVLISVYNIYCFFPRERIQLFQNVDESICINPDLISEKPVDLNESEIKIHIPICMATDAGYIYPSIVSMTSACLNKLNTTQIDYYILVPGDFSEDNIKKLKTVENHYANCKVEVVNMENKYTQAYISGKIKTPSYYRLSAPSLFPNISRMIYLDGDTLVYEDLTAIYIMNMDGLYYRGLLDNNKELENEFGIKTNVYICAGILVMNLELLRKENAEEKMIKFINDHPYLKWHDQTTLNYMSIGKLDGLPPKYGMFNYYKERDVRNFHKNFAKYRKKDSLEETLEAHRHPIIPHFTAVKPWKVRPTQKNLKAKENTKNQVKYWWYYAKLSDCYPNIYNMAMQDYLG